MLVSLIHLLVQVFLIIKRSLKRCSALTRNQTLFNLYKVLLPLSLEVLDINGSMESAGIVSLAELRLILLQYLRTIMFHSYIFLVFDQLNDICKSLEVQCKRYCIGCRVLGKLSLNITFRSHTGISASFASLRWKACCKAA